MLSSDLPAYLSLNCIFNGIVLCSWCCFVLIQPIFQKFNSFVTDVRKDRRTDRRTDTFSYRDAKTHQKIWFDLFKTRFDERPLRVASSKYTSLTLLMRCRKKRKQNLGSTFTSHAIDNVIVNLNEALKSRWAWSWFTFIFLSCLAYFPL